MISPATAWRRIEPLLAPLPTERRRRADAAWTVLADSLDGTVDVPFADVSAMDGYAVAGRPTAGDRLPVSGTVAAGDPPGATLTPGTALRIMTGAPVPTGAARVVPVELTDAGIETVTFTADAAERSHLRRRGEVMTAGQPLLSAGAVLTPGALGLLATHGHQEVAVHRAPRVAVLATGDEIVPPEQHPGPGQLRDSHTDFVRAACHSVGAELTSLGIAPDDEPSLEAAIAAALDYDVLLVTGGVSMGAFDFAEGVLERLGFELLFDAVAVQPGKPLVAAVRPGDSGSRPTLAFGLPGNPASAMVTFWLFVRPALRRLAGHHDGLWHGALTAELAAPLPGAKSRDRFLPAMVSFRDGRILATPVAPVGSHDVAAYALGSALVRIPGGAEPAAAGEPCEVLPLVSWPAG